MAGTFKLQQIKSATAFLLKADRHKKGLSREQVSFDLNVDYKTLSRWEIEGISTFSHMFKVIEYYNYQTPALYLQKLQFIIETELV